ncbi:hypothetical protein Ga0123461_2310 [Mariprofundus aestuarium]|uniref:Uncharacterized protein n=1 Tax=Mariprofundus aestuarium TaxID=1921086 RepID=A0A2K8L4E3_MARES|nr:hypothetical protein [Mariprofundus aestuarium]ATX80711.1 hypothetical protein Ga0123461_2310 [Mariprofundus aestuarium]
MVVIEFIEAVILLLGMVGIPGAIISILMSNYYAKKTMDRLREVSPEAYAELGKPSLFLNNTIRNMSKFFKWLHARKYKELNDESLTLMASNALKSRLAAAICMGAFSLAMVILSL